MCTCLHVDVFTCTVHFTPRLHNTPPTNFLNQRALSAKRTQGARAHSRHRADDTASCQLSCKSISAQRRECGVNGSECLDISRFSLARTTCNMKVNGKFTYGIGKQGYREHVDKVTDATCVRVYLSSPHLLAQFVGQSIASSSRRIIPRQELYFSVSSFDAAPARWKCETLHPRDL